MFKRIKIEISYILEKIHVVGLGGFIAAFLGVILWVNGGSLWYLLRGEAETKSLSLTVIFVVWLITYGISGAVMAIISLLTCYKRSFNKLFYSFVFSAVSYICMMVWYVLYFCTRLSIFAGIVLTVSFLLECLVHFSIGKRMCVLTLLILIIQIIQLYFIVFTYSPLF